MNSGSDTYKDYRMASGAAERLPESYARWSTTPNIINREDSVIHESEWPQIVRQDENELCGCVRPNEYAGVRFI